MVNAARALFDRLSETRSCVPSSQLKVCKMCIMRVSRFTKQKKKVTYIIYGVFRVALLSLLHSRPTKSLQHWHSAKLFASISYMLYRLLLLLSPSAFRSDWSILSSWRVHESSSTETIIADYSARSVEIRDYSRNTFFFLSESLNPRFLYWSPFFFAKHAQGSLRIE